jgi:hypothetical protein
VGIGRNGIHVFIYFVGTIALLRLMRGQEKAQHGSQQDQEHHCKKTVIFGHRAPSARSSLMSYLIL